VGSVPSGNERVAERPLYERVARATFGSDRLEQILAETTRGIEVASLGSLAGLVFGFAGRITCQV